MADLMSGPNAPLTRAFIFCGWRCITIDWLINPQHDLAHPEFQQELHETLQQADCICAALDCSTKSRAREIPRKFEDGRPAPKPLRSDEHPTGLPHLRGSDLRRVTKDNQACDFVLQEIQELADRGGVSLRENPARSLHWELPREKQMLASGDWQDTCYAACCFMGARCKQQRLRHNIQEISQWPPLQCHHQHDPDEWKPYTLDGQRVFPSHEEAEYTAPLAFAIAVSTSWWAVRVGRAKLRVPRMPPTEAVGRREHWLHYDPRSMRSWAMTPLAIQLGLRPIDPRERARVPRVRRAVDLLVDGHLPAKCIYVGRGHHSHKLPLSKWCSPYTPGHDCTADEWLPCYVEFIMSSKAAELPELAGCTLACDCPHDSDICEADALAGLVFDATAPEAPRYLAAAGGQAQRHHSTASRALRLGVISSRGVAASIPARVGLFTQEGVVTCFRRLFPGTWFQDFKFPMIEDLLNQAPFCEFPRWRDQHDLKADGPLGPHLASAALRQRQRHAEGQQAGALSHKAALPPLLSFGLDPDTHFQRACLRSQAPIPTEQSPLLDDDLWFVAELYASRSEDLPRLREQSLGILKELKQRWRSVGEHLRTFQTSAIRAVTRSRDIGLTALLVTLTSWADITYPYGLVAGLPAVGTAPPYGVFPEQPGRILTMEDVLDDWETHNYKTLASLKPGRHDAVLLEQSLNDAAQGFCSAPLTQAQLLRELRGEPFRLIPRCVIVQSSGKKRIIDNGDTGGQSERSSDWNKLVLCSPLRPAQHVGAVASLLTDKQWHTLTTADEWQSGGEDWPNAYRHSPISQAESRGCIVCFWHAERGEPAFQVYSSLLFGLPLAVTSFNRYSRLIEALGRRLTYSLVSLYFDDAHITDLQSGFGSSQQAFCQLNTLLGTPFAEEKKQLMQPTGTFLGLDHDFTNLSRGFVTFWARDRLIQKTAAMITEAQAHNSLSSGQASKLYGMLNFLEQGMYGRLGCAGLAAIKARQTERNRDLTPELQRNFDVIHSILRHRPCRELPVRPSECLRFVVASDAALEEPKQGTGGFLIVWHDPVGPVREAFIANISPEVYQLWEPGDRQIAQLEMVMIIYALTYRAQAFRGRRGIWLIDNVASLMCLIRGRSQSPDLERMCGLIHVMLYALRTWMYWEYIPSKSNWADAISRLGWSDPWWRTNGFTPFSVSCPLCLWHLPLPAVIRVVEFL